MSPQRSVEYLTGFLMGSFLGLSLELLFTTVYNLMAGWFGWAPLRPAWWMMVPLPLLTGLMMSKAIADLHLEDY